MNDKTTLIDPALEDRFFRALFKYPDLLRLTTGQLEASHFSTLAKSKLFEIMTTYWGEYSNVPTLDILEVEARKLLSDGEARNTIAVATRILKDIEAPAYEWVLSRIDLFVKQIRLQRGLYTTAGMLESGNFEEARRHIVETVRGGGIVSSASEDSLDISEEDLVAFAHEEYSLVSPTRIYALDDTIKGFYRGELFVLLAPLNVGKTWFVVHSAVAALLSGAYVLYFTLEMGQIKVKQRILQNISAVAKPYEAGQLRRIEKVWDEAFSKRSDKEVSTLFDTSKISGHLKTLKSFGGKLSIAEYPSGVATINDIHHKVALFDLTFDKLPDLIIVDGLLDMKSGVGPEHLRMGLTALTREFRAMASEYNCSVLITHQANREGQSAPTVGVEHAGESIGIMQVADVGISLNQNSQEQKEGKARLKIMRSRGTAKWGEVEIWQNLGLGQFCLKSMDKKDDDDEQVKPQRPSGGDGGKPQTVRPSGIVRKPKPKSGTSFVDEDE